MPQAQVRERMIAIARGEYKPKPSEPRIWFTLMKSLAEVNGFYMPQTGRPMIFMRWMPDMGELDVSF